MTDPETPGQSKPPAPALDLKPCPFCDAALVEIPVKAGSIQGRLHQHPKTGCWLDLQPVGPKDGPAWNRRGEPQAPTQPPAPCPRCHGSGKSPMWEGYPCSNCSWGAQAPAQLLSNPLRGMPTISRGQEALLPSGWISDAQPPAPAGELDGVNDESPEGLREFFAMLHRLVNRYGSSISGERFECRSALAKIETEIVRLRRAARTRTEGTAPAPAAPGLREQIEALRIEAERKRAGAYSDMSEAGWDGRVDAYTEVLALLNTPASPEKGSDA